MEQIVCVNPSPPSKKITAVEISELTPERRQIATATDAQSTRQTDEAIKD